MANKTNCFKNGKSYYRTTVTVGRKADGKPIRKEFYGKNKKEAEQKRDEYLRKVGNGLNIDYQNATLAPLMELWLFEVVKPSNKIKESSFERYESIFRNYIKTAPFAYNKLDEISSITIQQYYNTLFEKGKSTNVIHEIHLKLNAFFDYAVNQGFMLKNPTEKKKVVIPGVAEKEKKEVEAFSDEEVRLIINAASAENYIYRMLILFALGTGLRQGELLGLQWNCVDFDKKTVTVKQAVKTVTEIGRNGERKCKQKISTPKTKESIRTVPIPETLLLELKKHKVDEMQKCLKLGIKFSENNFVFTNSYGCVLKSNNLIISFHRFLKRNKIPVKKFHTLRHTYATQLYKAGVETMIISKMLGHTSLETTQIYTHVQDEQKKTAANRLNEIFI